MSRIYKNIIIGATPEGLALAEELANNTNDTVVISYNFIYGTKQIAGVEYLTAEAIYLQYSHGLFVLNTIFGVFKGTVCGTNLILATGTKPIKTTLKNTNICYKSLDISGRYKDQPVVVYGNNKEAVTYALDLSRRFGYVYLCTKEFDLDCDQRLIAKVNDKANIVHLPGCSVMSCKNDKNGKLAEVTLDTYATIKSSFLIFAIGRLPDIPAFTRRYIEQDSDGFVKVNEHNESTLVPGVFAIGSLCKKYTKRDLRKLVEYLQQRRS